MKRVMALVLVGVALVAAVALVLSLDRERQYRLLVVDGEAALRDGDSWGAIEALSGALVLRPDSMVAYYRRGLAYRAQGHEEQAIRDWKNAHALEPGAPEPLVALGELHDVLDQPALSASYYAQAAELLKDEAPAVLYALGLARYRAGEPAAAVDPLRRAASGNAGLAPAHYLLGLVYRDIGDIDAATTSLERAIEIDRTLVAAREELADIYRSEGRHGDAAAQLQAIAQLDPALDRRISVALSVSREGNHTAALQSLATLATQAPNDSRIDLAIGRVYLARAEATGDPTAIRRAREALEHALGGTARRSEGLALYGRVLHLSGEAEEAERILQEAVATSPAHRQAFAYLADTAESRAHYLLARDALLNLSALDGNTMSRDDATAMARRIGRLSLRGDDAATAARHLRRAVDAGSANAATLAWFAEAQWRIGELEGARATLERAIQADSTDADVVRIARTIR